MAEAEQDREEAATRAPSLRGKECSLARASERSKEGGTACAVVAQATLLGTTTMAMLLLLCLVVEVACGAAGFSAQHWARRQGAFVSFSAGQLGREEAVASSWGAHVSFIPYRAALLLSGQQS